jgi:hypothetical protein
LLLDGAFTFRAVYPRGKNPLVTGQDARWAPRAVLVMEAKSEICSCPKLNTAASHFTD